jgi:hypothetical protein
MTVFMVGKSSFKGEDVKRGAGSFVGRISRPGASRLEHARWKA